MFEVEKIGCVVGVYYVLCGMLEFWVDFELLYYDKNFCKDCLVIVYCVFGGCLVFVGKVLKDMGYV